MANLAPPLSTRNETAHERCDRHLAELLQEVRVAQTGVQVLFGFLLTVPFTVRFERLTGGEHALYFATLAIAGAAAMLLIAPTAQHRMLFRAGDKEHLVRTAHRYAVAGLACVALAMVGALSLVGEVVLGGPVPSALAGVAALACSWCWFLQPLLRRRALHRQAAEGEPVTTLRAMPGGHTLRRQDSAAG